MLGVIALALAGCGTHSRVELLQPTAPASQQHLKLTSDWSYESTAAGRRTWLLAYPLPGSRTGLRAFVIYLSAPDRSGTIPVAPDDPEAAQGFLVQEVGQLAGRTDLVGGTVRIRNTWLSKGKRRLDIDLRCEDGTTIRGRAILENAPGPIRAFEKEYELDVLEILPETQPTAGGRTAPRGATVQ